MVRVAILAGGYGTRLAEETSLRPKPLVEIGGRPILWHIMKHFSAHGLDEFCIALGYKGEMIKRFMIDYTDLAGDLTVSMEHRDATLDTDSGVPDRVARVRISRASVRRAFV